MSEKKTGENHIQPRSSDEFRQNENKLASDLVVASDHLGGDAPKIDDGCPSWAADDLVRLRLMEIALGNIPATADWKSQHLGGIQNKVFSEELSAYSDADIERFFAKTVRKLQAENFLADQIALFVNNRIGYAGGPRYCTEQEVLDEFL